jgi:hypothetical protein
MKILKYYAIGFKRHVELRASVNPIKEEVTESLIASSFSPEKFKLRIVHHTGGKVVKVLPTEVFERLTRIVVPEGECVSIPAGVAKQFKGG